MVSFFRQGLLPLLALLTAAAGAQTPPPAAPAPAFRPTLDGYRRFDDAPPIAWRSANDTVGQIGGWRQYAKEAQAPAPAPAGSASATVPAHPHAGHGQQ